MIHLYILHTECTKVFFFLKFNNKKRLFSRLPPKIAHGDVSFGLFRHFLLIVNTDTVYYFQNSNLIFWVQDKTIYLITLMNQFSSPIVKCSKEPPAM